MSSATASERVISILAKALIFLKPLYFKLKNGCQWWRQLMASKQSHKQWCRDLISIAGAILNLSVCRCDTIGYCLGGGHERWLLLGQLSLMFTFTTIHTRIQLEWVDTLTHLCAHVCTHAAWSHVFIMKHTCSDVNSESAAMQTKRSFYGLLVKIGCLAAHLHWYFF